MPVDQLTVDRLTADHSTLMDEVSREWIGHGTATRPADRQAALAGVRETYQAADLEPPGIVVWVDSPLAGVLCSHHLSSLVGHQAGSSVLTHLQGHLGYRYRHRIGDEVESAVNARVGRRVAAQAPALPMNLHDHLPTQAGSKLWNRVGERAAGRIPAQVRAAGAAHQTWRIPITDPDYLVTRGLNSCVYGQFEASTLAVYDTYGRIGIEPGGRLAGIMRVARSAGMWWPMLDAVVLSERPRELHLDSEGRLHRATGPAISYPDGWGMHAWHGTLVPPSLVNGDGWSMDRIIRQPDSELRRCAVERAADLHGWPDLIARAGWRQIGRTVPDPGNPDQTLSLYRVPDIYPTEVNLLLMTNGTTELDGTRRWYAETVPVTFTDPVAAAAWQIGLSAKHYRRTLRRT